jgi:hypothetical protein
MLKMQRRRRVGRTKFSVNSEGCKAPLQLLEFRDELNVCGDESAPTGMRVRKKAWPCHWPKRFYY